jgi:predicted nucleotidyltransferase
MDQAISALEQLTGKQWNAIRSAAETSQRLLSDLEKAVGDLTDPNIAVVVTGSLGRGEATPDSDADWFLLIDGSSDPDHALLAHEVDRRVKQVVPKAVGPTGTFAGIVTSHELVHYIAGNRDTNENLTRRILLLSESRALSNDLVRQRVIRNVLARYIIHDRSVRSASGKPHTIPHFFLNDVVRYWRTMASDYASKMWERERQGWGIRNIKLRFSRKLLFLWGLLAAFSGELFPTGEMQASTDEDEYLRLLAELIREQTDVTPLALLARTLLETQDDGFRRHFLFLR